MFWYGTPKDDLSVGYSFVPHNKFMSYEQGRKANHHGVPQKIEKKLDSSKKLTASEAQRVEGLDQINSDINLEPSERTTWLFDFEEDYDHYLDQIDDESSVDDEIIETSSSKDKKKRRKKKDQKGKDKKVPKTEKDLDSKKQKRKRKTETEEVEPSKKAKKSKPSDEDVQPPEKKKKSKKNHEDAKDDDVELPSTKKIKKIKKPKPVDKDEEANDRATQIQRGFDDKQVTCTNLQEQLVDSTNQAAQKQREFDEKYAEVVNLESNLQAECEEKLTLMSTWAQENKKNEKLQTILQQQKAKTDEDNAFLTKHADNLTKVCSDQKIKLQEMEDAANAIEAAERKRRRSNEGGKNDESSIIAAALPAQKRKTNEDNAFLKRHADESQTHGMQQGQGTSSKQCTVPPTAPVEGTSVPSSMDTIRSLQEELKESNDRERKIQHDLDEQCADNINLQKIKLQFEGALLQRDEQVEILQLEVATLKQQAISSQQENTHSHETEGVANATASAGGKRKRGSEEHMFTSHEMEGSAGDNSMTDMVMMRQYLLERECHSKEREQHSKERERHSKVLTQLFEIRRAEL